MKVVEVEETTYMALQDKGMVYGGSGGSRDTYHGLTAKQPWCSGSRGSRDNYHGLIGQ